MGSSVGCFLAPAHHLFICHSRFGFSPVFFFFVFTHRTSKQEQNANSHRLYLEVQPPKPLPKTKKYWAGDFPSWAMVALMFGFGILMRTIEYPRLSLVMLILAGGALLVTLVRALGTPSLIRTQSDTIFCAHSTPWPLVQNLENRHPVECDEVIHSIST